MSQLVTSGGVANMGADVTSSIAQWDDTTHGSVHIIIDNTDAVGVYHVQGSNDGSSWADLEEPVDVTSGVDVNDLVSIANAGFRFLRVFYDRTSGDGILDVIEFQKPTSRG